MRITSGYLKGKKIFSPPVKNLRLTGEKIRKAIFDVLAEAIENSSVLELFAGSGALGIEALSRGAKSVTFVDSDNICVNTIRKNIPDQLNARGIVLSSDYLNAISYLSRSGKKFDIIILDPPYRRGLAVLSLKKICQCCILKPHAIAVVEHHCDEEVGDFCSDRLKLISQKKYGQTKVSFFEFYPPSTGAYRQYRKNTLVAAAANECKQ